MTKSKGGKRVAKKRALLKGLRKELAVLQKQQDFLVDRESTIKDEGYSNPSFTQDLRLEIAEYPKFCTTHGLSCVSISIAMRKLLREFKRQDRYIDGVLKVIDKQIAAVNKKIEAKSRQVSKLEEELSKGSKPKVAVAVPTPTYEL